MEKAFRPMPLAQLARWIFKDLENQDTVLGIPKANFQIPDPKLGSQVLGRTLAAPLGVAAGPHSQLAQNIVAAWLCGARFMELKTVQALDELTVSRPCIDSADETFNCEWSQELKLEQSFDEYLHAWVLIHALAHKLGLKDPGTHFVMSVGYTLEGIQSPRVQAFIAAMRDASAALPAAIEAVAKVYPAVREITIPHQISNHITLSTMHGCPPAEIERIARYLMLDLGVDTWVKLNPTLLGPERLRGILNRTLGFAIDVPDAAFAHDPGFEDAMAMVRNLAQAAAGRSQAFGIKLSNTLEVVNHRGVFPESEKMMYLSGRALHPLTVTLAKLVSDATGGRVPISFCGGADALNFADLVADGLSPITVCTDLLKPGGYARLQQYLVNLDAAMGKEGSSTLEAFVQARSGGQGARFNLARHAETVIDDPRYARRERPLHLKGNRTLEAFDCIAAPCQEACPAHQNIPDYLWLVAHGKPAEAMHVILRTNPLPGVTGSICDHPCTERCVRNFYDTPVGIREVKRYAFEYSPTQSLDPVASNGIRVAIVGAGPAGISAATYLAQMGFRPEIFEAKDHPGGMVGGAVPRYRMKDGTLDIDLDRLRQVGVRIHTGMILGGNLTLASLRQDFPYVFLGVGAPKGKRLGIEGDAAAGVMDALEFLDRVRAQDSLDLGQRILVIGGGNSAMDAARSARRLAPKATVSIVYRRTRSEMPADPDEIRDCLLEGIELRDLLAPTRVVVDGGRVVGLACTPMGLGEPDASGRPRPVPTGAPDIILPADTIIPAIGQETDLSFLEGLEAKRHHNGTLITDPETGETSVAGLFAGGDVVRGPASVIKALADGRAAAQAIGRRHGQSLGAEPFLVKDSDTAALLEKKARKVEPQRVPVLPAAQRDGFDEVIQGLDPEAAQAEAQRCLACDTLCSLCVTVCPNRANHAYHAAPMVLDLPNLVVRGGKLVAGESKVFTLQQGIQILNLGDFCNACGNCATFCPTAGAPYQAKPQVWLDREAFDEATGDAFHFRVEGDALHLEAKLEGHHHSLCRRFAEMEYRSDCVSVRLDRTTLAIQSFEAITALEEGDTVELQPLGTLLALLNAESILPR
jgi:putative selenate reductase